MQSLSSKKLALVKADIIRPKCNKTWDEGTTERMKLRTPRIWRMSCAVTKNLLKDVDKKPRSIIVGTALGALEETTKHLDNLFDDGLGSPRHFIASVHNSIAGNLATDFKITGTNLTVCEGQNSFASAINLANLLNTDEYPVLLVIVDEKIELVSHIIPFLSEECQKYLINDWEEAACAFLLDSLPFGANQTSILAHGPEPVGILTPEEKYKALVRARDDKGVSMISLEKSSRSFLHPALTTYELISNAIPGKYVLGSYSPTAKAVAAITLCL